MAKNKKSQEEKDFEAEVAEMYRYENTKHENEDIEVWRKRTQHEEKMKLMYSMAMMYENNPATVALHEQALNRYNYYKDLYDRHEYE